MTWPTQLCPSHHFACVRYFPSCRTRLWCWRAVRRGPPSAVFVIILHACKTPLSLMPQVTGTLQGSAMRLSQARGTPRTATLTPLASSRTWRLASALAQTGMQLPPQPCRLKLDLLICVKLHFVTQRVLRHSTAACHCKGMTTPQSPAGHPGCCC